MSTAAASDRPDHRGGAFADHRMGNTRHIVASGELGKLGSLHHGGGHELRLHGEFEGGEHGARQYGQVGVTNTWRLSGSFRELSFSRVADSGRNHRAHEGQGLQERGEFVARGYAEEADAVITSFGPSMASAGNLSIPIAAAFSTSRMAS